MIIKYYNLFNQLHRLDGPAIDSPNQKRYFINGQEFSYQDYFSKISEINQFHLLLEEGRKLQDLLLPRIKKMQC